MINKKVSTTIGIVIILATAAVLFGGVFGWGYSKNSRTQTSDWKTYTSNQFGISFSYPKSMGKITENQIGYNGYDLSFTTPESGGHYNRGWVYIRKATTNESRFLSSQKTIESNNSITFYVTDLIVKGNWLERVYAFRNKDNDIVLVWFETDQEAGFNELNNQKKIEQVIEYQDFIKMLSTFKFTK